jgi:hypothetical protein
MAAGLLPRIRFPVRHWRGRSGITAETMRAASGWVMETSSTGHRMADRSRMLRNRHRVTCITPIPRMSPGIGRIDIRPRSPLPTGPTCRAARPKPSPFPDATAETRPSASRAVIRASSRSAISSFETRARARSSECDQKCSQLSRIVFRDSFSSWPGLTRPSTPSLLTAGNPPINRRGCLQSLFDTFRFLQRFAYP